jgi:hypothetical protein
VRPLSAGAAVRAEQPAAARRERQHFYGQPEAVLVEKSRLGDERGDPRRRFGAHVHSEEHRETPRKTREVRRREGEGQI